MKHNGTEVNSMTFNGQEVMSWVHNGVEVFVKVIPCKVTIEIGDYIASVKCDITEPDGSTWDTIVTEDTTITVGYGASISFTDTAKTDTAKYSYSCDSDNPESAIIYDNQTFIFNGSRSTKLYTVKLNIDSTVGGHDASGYYSMYYSGGIPYYLVYYGHILTITASPANSNSHETTTITKTITGSTTIDVSCTAKTYYLTVLGTISAANQDVQLQYSVNGLTGYATATSTSTGSVNFSIPVNYDDKVILKKIYMNSTTYHTFGSTTYTITGNKSINF